MRKSIFYQPLAVLMALLLSAPLSWLGSSGGGSRGHGAHLFQAAAQSSVTNPIQTKPEVNLSEYSAVSAYLATHSLPASDRDLIYTTGRKDLRDEIRGMMFSNLLGIIAKPAVDRTADEQATYSQFQKLVQEKEIAEYTAAVNEFNRFKNDPCHFTLDPDIAKQYNLSYDGAQWCGGRTFSSLFAGPPVPAVTYFMAYGLKNSYGSGSGLADIAAGTLINTAAAIGAMAGISVAATAATSAIVAALLPAAQMIVFAVENYAIFLAGGVFPQVLGRIIGTIGPVSAACVDAIGVATLVAGPTFIIGVASIIGTIAGFQAYSNEQYLKDAENLSNMLASATNNPPDLAAFAADKTGLLKLGLIFAAQTAPDTPGTAPLPAHRTDWRDLVFSIGSNNPMATTVRDTLRYYGWEGSNEIWSAQTYGGWLVQTCSGSACKQPDSLSTSIRFLWTDYQGHTTKYTASRIGDHVVSDKWAVTMAEPGPNDKFCPPDPSTGLTTNATAGNLGIWMPSSVGRCSSFVTDKLFMDDANGLSTPTVSGGSAYVTVSLRVLPGVSTNPPQFTSAASAQTFYDTPFRFLVTTTGGSIPATLTLSTGGLPNGLTFTDNGDGTAAIAGTISNGGACGVLVGGACGSFTITATNPWGVATQDFNLGFGYAPSATLATTSATFIAGIPNFVTVFSQGAQTPVTWGMMGPNGSPLPSWLSLNDQGDGTAVLIGTPPLGTVAAIPLNISVWSTGSAPGILNFGANFTLNVSDAPGFLTLDAGTFYVGQDSNEFTILPPGGSGPHPLSATVTSGTISITAGKLPQGLIDHSSGTSLTISGIPAAGTGGAYPLTLTATNPSGSISRDVNLEVFEQPRITTDVNMQPNFYQFHQGQRNSFSFTTLGYPDRGQEPMAANQPAPTDPNQALGMYFTVTGLPSGFSASNLDPTGRATGTLTISGTPAQADLGQHVITIKAENGVGTAAEQSFTLNFGRTLGDVNGDGFTDCFDVLALDGAFGRYIGESGYNTRADINNDGAINWADMKLVWTHIDFAGAVTTACQQAKHTPSTPAVFQHTLDGASTSHEDTIIYYITSGGIRDSASLSKGIWTDLHGSGQDLLYLAWDGTLWSARVLDDGVTFRETNTATGEVRISQVLEYQTWDGSHWKVSVIRPSW